MIYLLAVVIPPVAVLLTGTPKQVLINFILTCFLWLPGVIHALLVLKER